MFSDLHMSVYNRYYEELRRYSTVLGHDACTRDIYIGVKPGILSARMLWQCHKKLTVPESRFQHRIDSSSLSN